MLEKGETETAWWQQAKEIVADALEEDSTTARIALVARPCGTDARLKAEVESLLDQTTGPLETCAADVSPLHPQQLALAEATRIGTYSIVRELGRGGMGA